MTIPVQPESQPYQPTAEQLERTAALTRFNRLYVYLPLIIFSAVGLFLLGLMLWGVFSPNENGAIGLMSGLADLIVIMTVIPLLLLCAVVPAAAIGLVVYRRQQPQRKHGRFQTLLWRLDTLITKAQSKTATTLPKAAAPVIKGHAWAAYVRALVENIKKLFARR